MRRRPGCRGRRTFRSRGAGCRPVEIPPRAHAARSPRRAPPPCRAPRPSAAGPRTLAFLERLENQCFLLCPHAFEARIRPSRAARSRSSSVRILEATVQQRHGLGSDALQVEQVENRRRELLEEFLVIAAVPGLDQLGNLARRDPCRCRECPADRLRRTARPRLGKCAIVSAAFRYARILNGFSLLISSRSPISARTRASARLSMSVDAGHGRCAHAAIIGTGRVASAATAASAGTDVASAGTDVASAWTDAASAWTDVASARDRCSFRETDVASAFRRKSLAELGHGFHGRAQIETRIPETSWPTPASPAW